MKKCLNIVFIFSILLFLGTFKYINVYASSNIKAKEFLNEQSELIKNISENIDLIKNNNNIKDNYVNFIKYDNNIKIKLSESILKYGENKEVQKLSKNLIKESMEDNQKIEKNIEFLKEEIEYKNIEEFYEEYNKYYKRMICELEKICIETNIEKNYLKSYHKINEFELNVINSFLKHTSNDDIKSYSDNKIKLLKEENKRIENTYKK